MAKKQKKSGSKRKKTRKAVNPFARQGSSRQQRARANKASGRTKARKLSATARKKIGAASRKRWRERKGAGRPGKTGKGHIPLAVLKKNHKNLGNLIAVREKSPASWA